LTGFGPNLACLEAACRHRGLLKRMLPAPLRALDPETAQRVVAVLESVGVVPQPEGAASQLSRA
jgi:4-hydroxy-tetrahydrodipicolinate synthase